MNSVLAEDIREILIHSELFKDLAGKKILVTGSTGFLGSVVIRTLAAANDTYDLNMTIMAHARSAGKARAVLQETLDRDDLQLVCTDTFSFDVPCDYIFHTASPTRSLYFIEHPVETIGTILDGTQCMLKLAKKYQATLVYLSSMEEYGVPYTSGETMTEDKIGVIDHLLPRSCYSEGKRMAECLCAAYFSEYGTDIRIARLAQTFGSGISSEDNRVSMQFAKSVIQKKDIVLHTEGKSLSNFCYITDAVSGLLTIVAKGTKGEAYNICNDAEIKSIREIAGLVAEKVSGEIKVVIDIPEGRNFGYAPYNDMKLSSAKLRQLGWIPSVGVEEGYRRLVRFLRVGLEGDRL